MSKMRKVAIPDGIGGTVYLDMPESDVKVLKEEAEKLGISVAELIVGMLAESDSLDEIVEMSFYNQSNGYFVSKAYIPTEFMEALLEIAKKRKMTFGMLLYDVFRFYVDANSKSEGLEVDESDGFDEIGASDVANP